MSSLRDNHLKPGLHPELERQINYSVPGMAHWSGTGPQGRTCRECVFWGEVSKGAEAYHAATGKHGGAIKPQRCRKYKALMQGHVGDKIEYNTLACKYFEGYEKPSDVPPSYMPGIKGRRP